MSRSARLLDLLQMLRRHRRPVAAARLADELGVSLRTVYRDVATLMATGAPIAGSAGLGYVLQPGFFLPPLMFDADEVDALILGLHLVQKRGDAGLERGASDALAKISAVLPAVFEDAAATSGLLAGPAGSHAPHLAVVRQAIRDEQILHLSYRDKDGAVTERAVWPIAVGFFRDTDVLAAWCTIRAGFRHFRLDRLAAASPTGTRYARRRRLLLAEWRLSIGLPPQRGSLLPESGKGQR